MDVADAMGKALDWDSERATWPHAERSRFVEAGGWRWHVQHFRAPSAQARTQAEPVLLLHGTGASSHSWRQLAPLLLPRHGEVLVPDLPGHAFTASVGARDVSLPAVAEAVAALLQALGVRVARIIGHSAGAAIGAQMCLARLAAPAELVSLNGALLPLSGPVQQWFSPIAKWLVMNPLVPHFFAWQAGQPAVLRKLVASTGSRIDDEGTALYGRLVCNAGHAAGALRLMASWHLAPLAAALPRLPVPLRLIAGDADLTVPPEQAREVHRRVPGSRLIVLPGLGHLAHEEDPQAVLRALEEPLAAEAGRPPAAPDSSRAAASDRLCRTT